MYSSDIQFDRFQIDLRRRLLLADGKIVPLHGRAFDILVFLVAQRQRAVGRDEILAEIFRGLVVTPENVTVQIHTIRKAISGAGGDGQVIKTLPGKRYQFVADVTLGMAPAPGDEADVQEPDAISPVQDARKPARSAIWLAGLGVLALLAALGVSTCNLPVPPPPRLSIVVMPFENLSDDRGQDYLAYAISDDLSTDLAHIPESTVIARESAYNLRSKHATLQQIGAQLHVRYVLEGSLRVEDGQYHVNSQLADALTGAGLWMERFDVHAGKIADIRDQIVRHIYSTLNFQLDRLESSRSMHDRPNDPDALDLYFRARSRLDWDHSMAGFDFAQQRLEGAIAQQTDFADAQAELAWMLFRKVSTMPDPNDAADFSEAKDATTKALALSPQNVLALAARGRLHEIEGDCAAASADARLAMAIESASLQAHTVLAACALVEERFDDAAAELETILRLNPVSPSNPPRYGALGLIRLVQGRYGEAIDLLKQARSGDEAGGDMSPSEESRIMLIAAEELHGDHDLARDQETAFARRFPGRTTWRISTYLTKSWLKLAGVQRLLSALQSAGMPAFAGEDAPGLPEGARTCTGSDFALTPRTLVGGSTLRTSDVVKRLQEPHAPIVIDVGSGTFPIGGAFIYDPTSGMSANAFAAAVAAQHARQKDAPILILGDGPTGCDPYNAAVQLVSQGYSNVGWYRGGEESWFAAQASAQDSPVSNRK